MSHDEPRTPKEASKGQTSPVRTCIGCCRRETVGRLVRIVLLAAGESGRCEAVLDPEGRAPGRGAWLHPDRTCLDLAIRRHALSRAFRTRSPIEHGALVSGLEELVMDPTKAG